jgi:hypothetical protein
MCSKSRHFKIVKLTPEIPICSDESENDYDYESLVSRILLCKKVDDRLTCFEKYQNYVQNELEQSIATANIN